jgi:hypothetical protein
MNHRPVWVKRLPGILLFGIMLIVLAWAIRSLGQGGLPSPAITVSLPAAASQTSVPPATDLGSSPTASLTSPAYPPPGPEITPNTPEYGPASTLTPTATPWPVSELPPLPTYAPPGPFKGMRLVYVRIGVTPDSGYQSINIDGTELIRYSIPDEQRSLLDIEQFRPSPDGKHIVYSLWNTMEPSRSSIWVIDEDGSNLRQLVLPRNGLFPIDAIWSPDGQQIAYRGIYRDDSGNLHDSEIWQIDINGENERLVARDTELLHVGGPKANTFFWGLNGYIYLGNFYKQLVAVNPESGEVYKLLDHVDTVWVDKALSPDGLHLYFTPTMLEMNPELLRFIPAIDDKLVKGRFDGWSGDGSFMIFESETHIRLVNPRTGEERLIETPDRLPDISSYVSPDASFLIYRSAEGLHLINLLSSQVTDQFLIEDGLDQWRTVDVFILGWLPEN